MTDGTVLLPNGWKLSPAGNQTTVGDLPLNLDISPDGRYVICTNNGAGAHSVSIVETASWMVVSTVPLSKSWLGIKFIDRGKRFLVSGGNDNRVLIYAFAGGKATLVDSIALAQPWPDGKLWVGGLDADEEGGSLYVCTRQDNAFHVVGLSSRKVLKTLQLTGKPYTCLVSRRHPLVFISLWESGRVLLFDRASMTVLESIPVGEHPNDMVEALDGQRLFVANGNLNTVSVIDLAQHTVTETLSSALSPELLPGSTPNSVALSPDGTQLYVANADNNYLAVMDVSVAGRSRSIGFIPTGWYPTSVRILPSGAIVVANGKGTISKANPRGPNPTVHHAPDEQYIGRLFLGTLSLIPVPSADDLQRYTMQVYANSPVTSPRTASLPDNQPTPLPRNPGELSPIKHVIYIIKENRTYDQVFGDIPQGNGDPSLCLFPDSVTPNHHALAREFVLLDNLYCDAEVSADGHNWSMGAYATDFVEKSWPTMYGGKGGEYEFDGPFSLAYPSRGYLCDNCRRNGVSYRSYGEFAQNAEGPGDSARGKTESLVGHVAPFYRGWDLSYSDIQRATDWMNEFDQYERDGTLPQLQIITLPNDHTQGTTKGSLTPRAYVAQNDLALGVIVERISHSRYWKESAIFVIEDDAQNGPDHVDAHRTVALVISPYVRRRTVDSELYSTSSMVRTIELILGLPPMSQFDAASTPMHTSFTMKADMLPFTHRTPAVNLQELNIAGAYGQERSAEFNFTRQDAIPDIELNEIIWKSIRGADSPMPAPVRSAFVRVRDSKQQGTADE
jgi:YVTN family beta-propeller protein